jgi:glycosyltransferase involved in cell wall biosynthesis
LNIFISNSTEIFAGGEDYVLILAKYLQQRGHRVWVSANPGHLLLRKCTEAGVAIIPISYTGMPRVFSVASEVRKHLQRLSVGVIHSNANYDRTVAGIAAAWTKTRHVASVHSAHSIQHNITHWLRNKFGTDHFIADAELVKNVLVNDDGIAADRITVIPIGVEGSPKELETMWRQKTRLAWGATPETYVIGNVARLVPFKGHRYLIDAIAQVVKSNQNVICVVIGDGELMAALQEQTKSLGIDSYMRFLGFRDNLHELYPAFDVYCHSSVELEAEAFPVAILRALASGLPVVATKVGGIGLTVEEGISGHLVQPENSAALANALLHIIGDPKLCRSMGEASFDLFTKNFRATAMAERVERVYLRVAHR